MNKINDKVKDFYNSTGWKKSGEVSEDAKIVIDNMSTLYLAGSTIDYNNDLMSSGFEIKNPNAASSCSCGNSFACG